MFRLSRAGVTALSPNGTMADNIGTLSVCCTMLVCIAFVFMANLLDWMDKYIATLNVCGALLICILFGFVAQLFKLMDGPQSLSRFVITAAFPFAVIQGLFTLDLKNVDVWLFVGSFFFIRVLAAIIAVVLIHIPWLSDLRVDKQKTDDECGGVCRPLVDRQPAEKEKESEETVVPLNAAESADRSGMPQSSERETRSGNGGSAETEQERSRLEGVGMKVGWFCIYWVCISWISTVLLGVPILKAVLGPKYGPLGVTAGISSFLFQLPGILLCLETYAQTAHAPRIQSSYSLVDMNRPTRDMRTQQTGAHAHTDSTDQSSSTSVPIASASPPQTHVFTPRVIGLIFLRLVKTPVFPAIIIGLIGSLTDWGPRIVGTNPRTDYRSIGTAIEWLGACATPVAMFAMGSFLAMHSRTVLRAWRPAVVLSIMKCVVVPLAMIGVCAAIGLGNNSKNGHYYARAAVLVASLPISQASFSFANQFNLGCEVVTGCLFIGTILMLPVTVFWVWILDVFHLWEI